MNQQTSPDENPAFEQDVDLEKEKEYSLSQESSQKQEQESSQEQEQEQLLNAKNKDIQIHPFKIHPFIKRRINYYNCVMAGRVLTPLFKTYFKNTVNTIANVLIARGYGGIKPSSYSVGAAGRKRIILLYSRLSCDLELFFYYLENHLTANELDQLKPLLASNREQRQKFCFDANSPEILLFEKIYDKYIDFLKSLSKDERQRLAKCVAALYLEDIAKSDKPAAYQNQKTLEELKKPAIIPHHIIPQGSDGVPRSVINNKKNLIKLNNMQHALAHLLRYMFSNRLDIDLRAIGLAGVDGITKYNEFFGKSNSQPEKIETLENESLADEAKKVAFGVGTNNTFFGANLLTIVLCCLDWNLNYYQATRGKVLLAAKQQPPIRTLKLKAQPGLTVPQLITVKLANHGKQLEEWINSFNLSNSGQNQIPPTKDLPSRMGRLADKIIGPSSEVLGTDVKKGGSNANVGNVLGFEIDFFSWEGKDSVGNTLYAKIGITEIRFLVIKILDIMEGFAESDILYRPALDSNGRDIAGQLVVNLPSDNDVLEWMALGDLSYDEDYPREFFNYLFTVTALYLYIIYRKDVYAIEWPRIKREVELFRKLTTRNQKEAEDYVRSQML